MNSLKLGLVYAMKYVHNWAVDRGWWTDLETGERRDRNKGEMIALMHSELSEMLEGVRKDLPSDKISGFMMEEEEAADLLIRLLDYCGGFNIRLVDAFFAKMKYNEERDDHKIENRRGEMGKKF